MMVSIHLLFFAAPMHSKTCESRIEKCVPQILQEISLNDLLNEYKNAPRHDASGCWYFLRSFVELKDVALMVTIAIDSPEKAQTVFYYLNHFRS